MMADTNTTEVDNSGDSWFSGIGDFLTGLATEAVDYKKSLISLDIEKARAYRDEQLNTVPKDTQNGAQPGDPLNGTSGRDSDAYRLAEQEREDNQKMLIIALVGVGLLIYMVKD